MDLMHESAQLTYSTQDSLDARSQIFEAMNSYAATPEEKERSLGLFIRGSLLARILAIAELYKIIVDIPGVVFDIGTWRGQTGILCENFRAVYEPLNFNRRVICFDTFEGYKGFSNKDRPSELHKEGTYALSGEDYAQFLKRLFVLHERSNALGHNVNKHSVICGDCRLTIPQYFNSSPGQVVALAFFDINAYAPTLEAFNIVWNRMVPGGIVAFWQLTRESVPAEGMVYAENILGSINHLIYKSAIYPGLCYIQK